jgi:hypothetical protein
VSNKNRTTKYPNGLQSFVIPNPGPTVEEISTSTDTTVIGTTGARGDCGTTFLVNQTCVITLPSIAIGNNFTYVNNGPDGTVQISLSPAAIDGIGWVGSKTDDKDLINTLATARRGDYVTISSGDAVVAWQVVESAGIWAKEA